MNQRYTIAEILALALCELFPNTRLLQSTISDVDFAYDAILKEPITKESLPIIEERMRMLVKQNIPCKPFEMMRKNAIDLFKHRKQDLIIDKLSKLNSTTVDILQIGDFIDLCPPEYAKNTKELGPFKLLEIESPSPTVTRIRGAIFSDQASLKQFVKRYESNKRNNYLLLGPKMGLFDASFNWYPKGAALLQTLSNLASQQLPLYTRIYNLPVISPPHPKELPLRWLCGERFYTLCSNEQIEQETISCLQLIDKIVTMFEINSYRYITAESKRFKNFIDTSNDYILDKQGEKRYLLRVELGLEDAIGRQWRGPFISVTEQKEHFLVEGSLTGDLTHFAAMVIERYAGQLPLWLENEINKIWKKELTS